MTTTNIPPAYDRMVELLREKAVLNSCGSLLGWDEQTYMPPAGGEHRANQLALLAGLTHERATTPELGGLLGELKEFEESAGSESVLAVNIRAARRDYDRATQLPRKLVEEMTREISLAQQKWVAARKQADFSIFQKSLESIIRLKREEASILKKEGETLYDALLDEYEPGMRAEQVQALFDPLREGVIKLLQQIKDSSVEPKTEILKRSYPTDRQHELGQAAAAQIGFDFERGRLDTTAHPFCSEIGPGDCRLTTRYFENFFNSGFFGILHEAGHGMYEQGLNVEQYGLAMGLSVSLGIHESQSLLWENFVGRSRPFWNHFYPKVQGMYPESLNGVSLDEFYTAINDVRPSYIRVEADELTYNLHIMLRFELEQKLLAGELEAADVPEVWNSRFTEYLGVTPENDAQGCLQDIHWSAGLMGYFPTYALGKMYSAQFFKAAQNEIPDLSDLIANGEFGELKSWLNKNIHDRGQQYQARDLVKVVTGNELSEKPLLEALGTKYGEIYGF
ncbi:Thermostable carboxypeptidase 1 [Polystyrenella longa]|uniref:Metal-dependent carboxypeptidase n=2 Tax=Polystyrenella longa TaxID=2528007 RepID=A0A518CHY2_9PLAN|nr:Thermostable carboxypeptidase 1 [Polystyrenella longa]